MQIKATHSNASMVDQLSAFFTQVDPRVVIETLINDAVSDQLLKVDLMAHYHDAALAVKWATAALQFRAEITGKPYKLENAFTLIQFADLPVDEVYNRKRAEQIKKMPGMILVVMLFNRVDDQVAVASTFYIDRTGELALIPHELRRIFNHLRTYYRESKISNHTQVSVN